MMTKDDVLRELELLPVWQLRTPVQNVLIEKMPNLENQPAVKIAAEITPQVPMPEAPTIDVEFDYYQSENSAWIFICPASRMDTAPQSMLFDNILIALQIKAKKTAVNLTDCGAKVLIVMGEKTAQTLLNSTETIASLRGKQHELHNLPLIVTYDTNDMLQNLANKAKTWDDLCMALQLLNA